MTIPLKKIALIGFAVLLDGMAGLFGGLLPTAFVRRHMTLLLAFAAGTLLGASFFDLLPEAFASQTAPAELMGAVLMGFIAFYVMESFLGSHAAGQSGHKHDAVGPLILIGDALHNITDGVAIAAAILADWRAGIATTIAVIFHEVPQEIGDYAILVTHGYSRGRALFLLVLVQLSAFIGAIGVLAAEKLAANSAPLLMALSAGGFIYIAAADLLPELRRQRRGDDRKVAQFVAFSAGLLAIAAFRAFARDSL